MSSPTAEVTTIAIARKAIVSTVARYPEEGIEESILIMGNMLVGIDEWTTLNILAMMERMGEIKRRNNTVFPVDKNPPMPPEAKVTIAANAVRNFVVELVAKHPTDGVHEEVIIFALADVGLGRTSAMLILSAMQAFGDIVHNGNRVYPKE